MVDFIKYQLGLKYSYKEIKMLSYVDKLSQTHKLTAIFTITSADAIPNHLSHISL